MLKRQKMLAPENWTCEKKKCLKSWNVTSYNVPAYFTCKIRIYYLDQVAKIIEFILTNILNAAS